MLGGDTGAWGSCRKGSWGQGWPMGNKMDGYSHATHKPLPVGRKGSNSWEPSLLRCRNGEDLRDSGISSAMKHLINGATVKFDNEE